MGGACSMHGNYERYIHTKCWSENLNGIDYLEDLDVDGRIVLWIVKEIGWEGVDWIQLGQGRVQYWLLASTLMNLRVS